VLFSINAIKTPFARFDFKPSPNSVLTAYYRQSQINTYSHLVQPNFPHLLFSSAYNATEKPRIDFSSADNSLKALAGRSLVFFQGQQKALMEAFNKAAASDNNINEETNSPLRFNEDEQQWLKAHPQIKVGVRQDLAPYEWIDSQGRYQGLVADYMAMIEQKMGVKFEWVSDNSWEDMLELAKNGGLDILADASKSPATDEYLLFTEPYINTPVVIIDNGLGSFIGNLDGLSGKQVTIEKSSFMEELIKRNYPQIELCPLTSFKEGLQRVSLGKADAFVGDAGAINYIIKRNGWLNLRFSGDTHHRKWHRIATSKANPVLAGIITKALNDIPVAEREKIENRWLTLPVKQAIGINTLIRYSLGVLLAFALILLWNKYLRQEIRRRKQIEEKLLKDQDSLLMAANVFAHTREGILITDKTARIIDMNPAFSMITGYSREEILNKNASLLSAGIHDNFFYKAIWDDLSSKGHWSGEIWNRRKNGEIYAEWLTISAVHNTYGELINYIGNFSDITLLKQHEQKLEHIAHYDALTGVPNRVLLADRMQLACAQSKRDNNLLAVGYLDLDGFKPINDRFGHSTGDQLLIEIAQRIKDTLREGDTVARLGGDEFVFLLLGLNKVEECEATLQRLLREISRPVVLQSQNVLVSASIGISIFPIDDIDSDTLLRHADQAMYQAKQSGKNCYHIYDPELDRRMHSHREALDQIEKALGRDEFELYFQPKIDMLKGQVIGAEALIRWQHPERGLMMPADFLPLIEGNVLSVKMDFWVMEQAFKQMLEWQAYGLRLLISVNVSARTLQTVDFVSRLEALLNAYQQVNPTFFELEILESEALNDLIYISKVIKSCQELGVQFALDDFGTGYSSLTYLKRLPTQTLKIDRSFVRDMLEDEEDLAIVRGIIGLANSFHLQVVAEGVESAEHGMALLGLNCRYGQGYGIAKPMPANQISDWFEHWELPDTWKTPVNDSLFQHTE
jgi:diguanylate cyclase (GGDEF)-like protein/PAS domain S-box-containing protein